MRDHIGNIRTFRTRQFTVSADAFYDYDTDLSFDETGEVRAKLESGEYVAFQVEVKVMHDDLGTVGRDTLGGCIYTSIVAFQDHRECGKYNRDLPPDTASRCGSYFSGMIQSAIAEARKNIASAQNIRVRA